jgi:SAM-dependent methyltransferase
MRNYDDEAKDNEGRSYNYKFDTIFRSLMLKDFGPFIDSSKFSESLEIGSFDGSMTAQILNYVSSLTVVEPSHEMVSEIESRFGAKVKIIESTIDNLDIRERFQNIFLIHTLEHLDNPVADLKKIKKLLAREGRLFVAVPNANALSRQVAVHMGLASHNSVVLQSEALQGHTRTYSLDTLRRDLLAAELKIEVLSGVFLKCLANFQLDASLKAGIINEAFINASNSLAKIYPDFSASIYAICTLPRD